jgi:hypothetical protein
MAKDESFSNGLYPKKNSFNHLVSNFPVLNHFSPLSDYYFSLSSLVPESSFEILKMRGGFASIKSVCVRRVSLITN